jgi:hypothetical protein
VELRGSGMQSKDHVLLDAGIKPASSVQTANIEMKGPLHPRNAAASGIAAVIEFVRGHWSRFLVISAVVLVPCFWHRHIEAGDVPSHLYNAWLAQLITNGQAPGLFLAHQYSNILFDLTLSRLGNLFGLALAEKIAVSAAVLIFFWGTFAMVCSASRTANPKTIPWFLTPCLAALAYGYTFEAGFINYYLSIGLASFGLALILQSDMRSFGSVLADAFVVLFLVPLIWLASPLGLFVLASGGAYIVSTKVLPARRHIYLFLVAILALIALHFFIKFHHWDTPWFTPNIRILDGADQLVLYGPHYLLLSRLLEFFFLASLLVDAAQRWRTPQTRQFFPLPIQLFSLALLTVLMLPTGLTPPARYFGAMNSLIFLKERLTSVVAIFACCLLAQIRPRKWHSAGLAALAAIFFSYLYRDTATISRMEDQIESFVAPLPFGQRVIEKTILLPGDRIGMLHIIDRACIGRCFSYGNYEAATRQFRVRAQSENPFVLPTNEAVDAVRIGKYVVQQRDLPLYEVYECVPDSTAVCVRELRAGEENARVDTSPP